MLLLVVIVLVGVAVGKELPPFLHVCNRNDPNLDKCVMKAVEEVRPYLVTGSPEYNIPSIEPLIINDLINDKAAGMHLSTTDVKTYGCSDFTVENIKLDIENHLYDIDVTLPLLRIDAKYAIDGKLLLVPIRGHGNFRANITNCKSKTILQGEIYEKDGTEYLKFISSNLTVKVGGGHVLLDNLFGGEKILSDAINDAINKNLHMFLKELLPVIEKALSNIFLDIGNKIVEPYTLDQLFPE